MLAARIRWALQARLSASRQLASVPSSQVNPALNPFQVFDRHAKLLQKDRAAAREDGNRSRTVDYVRDEVADRMIERFLASAVADPPFIFPTEILCRM